MRYISGNKHKEYNLLIKKLNNYTYSKISGYFPNFDKDEIMQEAKDIIADCLNKAALENMTYSDDFNNRKEYKSDLEKAFFFIRDKLLSNMIKKNLKMKYKIIVNVNEFGDESESEVFGRDNKEIRYTREEIEIISAVMQDSNCFEHDFDEIYVDILARIERKLWEDREELTLSILKLIQDGFKRREIIEKLNIEENEYDNKKKKIINTGKRILRFLPESEYVFVRNYFLDL